MKKVLPFKLILATVLAITTIIASCKKTDKAILTADATVINSGAQELDGCGWAIKIGNDFYNPTNLPENYKIENKQVKITYYLLTTRFNCATYSVNSLTGAAFQQIDIKTIVNK